MMRFRRNRLFIWTCHLAIVLTVLVGLSPFVNGQQPAAAPTTLRPGIVIDPATNIVYAMTPEGVAAIDLASGAKRWTTSSAAKPLAIASNRLISQVEPKIRTNELELAVLDTTEKGAIAARGVTELPSFVRVAIGQTLEGRFESEARPQAGSAVVSWRYEGQPLRGLVRERESGTNDAVAPSQPTGASAEGAVQMDLATGAVSPVAADAATRPAARRWIVETNEKVSGAGASATQYESADGRHILASERIADDKTWAKYRWTVYEKGTNKRVGQFQTHLAFTPFVVRDSLLIYETTPYVRGGSAEPAKLRGINLATGQETWSVEVRELEFRGPFPP